jgi:peroxiredoxin
MPKNSIACILVLPLLVLGVSLSFAQTDSASKIISDCIARLSQIHSGSIRYTMTGNTVYKLEMKTDTAIFSFDELGDKMTERFVLDRGLNLYFYDGEDFFAIDRGGESYTKTAFDGKSALQKIGSDIPGPFANQGAALRKYASNKIDTLSCRDSIIMGKDCKVLEVRAHDEGAAENSRKHLVVKYYLSWDGEILGYRYEVQELGRPIAQEVHILHAQYNAESRKELARLIDITKEHLRTFKQDTLSISAQTRNSADNLLPIGTKAPDFAAISIEGDTIDLYTVHGKVILLDFWFAACMPCRNFTPFLKSMQEKYRSKGLVVLGVDPYDKATSLVASTSNSLQVNYPEMMLPEIYQAEYGVSVYPTVYLIDEKKNVIHTQMGYSTSREQELEAAIQNALQ